eukprot:CAMPEP_0115861974 /NCGR_PEP_ID=MMETSP0287-20121206/17937_1 /TAXON_ID=412157 /ORGANISM="Chrysochromulina rotalis, Strain UIO044" /LENGTH=154 /DNA_ID=CAMNT_0003316381 /DNA_START=356 /DNA_END=818 /DNA_ORIENTATION=-
MKHARLARSSARASQPAGREALRHEVLTWPPRRGNGRSTVLSVQHGHHFAVDADAREVAALYQSRVMQTMLARACRYLPNPFCAHEALLDLAASVRIQQAFLNAADGKAIAILRATAHALGKGHDLTLARHTHARKNVRCGGGEVGHAEAEELK